MNVWCIHMYILCVIIKSINVQIYTRVFTYIYVYMYDECLYKHTHTHLYNMHGCVIVLHIYYMYTNIYLHEATALKYNTQSGKLLLGRFIYPGDDEVMRGRCADRWRIRWGVKAGKNTDNWWTGRKQPSARWCQTRSDKNRWLVRWRWLRSRGCVSFCQDEQTEVVSFWKHLSDLFFSDIQTGIDVFAIEKVMWPLRESPVCLPPPRRWSHPFTPFSPDPHDSSLSLDFYLELSRLAVGPTAWTLACSNVRVCLFSSNQL